MEFTCSGYPSPHRTMRRVCERSLCAPDGLTPKKIVLSTHLWPIVPLSTYLLTPTFTFTVLVYLTRDASTRRAHHVALESTMIRSDYSNIPSTFRKAIRLGSQVVEGVGCVLDQHYFDSPLSTSLWGRVQKPDLYDTYKFRHTCH